MTLQLSLHALALAGAVCLTVIAVGGVAGVPGWAQAGLIAVLLAGLAAVGRVRAARVPPKTVPTPAQPSVPGPTLPLGLGRTLLHRMPAPLIVIAENRRLTYANPAALDMLPTAQPGAHYSAMIRAPAFVDAVDTILSDRQDLRFAFSMMRGGERFFEARATYVPAASAQEFGDSAQIIVLLEDRTRDKAVLQTRSDFVANASHELRTPLASILGYIETLQGHARDDPEARELFLGIMLAQAQRMQRLVDDLMSLSRIEMNAHVRPDTAVDIYAVASEAAAAMFPQATAADVLLQIELPRDACGPAVLADRDQLAQVVVNLIDNAIKYAGSGQKVRVAVADPDARFPGQLGISVIDAGPGIAREHVPRLTERFFRVSPAQSKDMGGTGLGLAITKHILARHQGALDIKSQVGQGSTFTFWMPRAPDAAVFSQ